MNDETESALWALKRELSSLKRDSETRFNCDFSHAIKFTEYQIEMLEYFGSWNNKVSEFFINRDFEIIDKDIKENI